MIDSLKQVLAGDISDSLFFAAQCKPVDTYASFQF